MRVSRKRQLIADGLLFLVTIVWGGTFVMVKDATSAYPVFSFLAIRFGLASAALVLVAGRRLRTLDRKGVGAGVLIGLFLFAGYALQTLGLQYTSASKAALITGLSVALVPLISAVLNKRVPGISSLLGVGLATGGLFWLTLGGSGSGLAIEGGDLIVLCGALGFALHIVSVSVFAPRVDVLALTTVQLLTVAILSAGLSLGQGWGSSPVWPVPSWDVVGAASFTGILATAVAFSLQTSMQRFTTPTHTALIFTAEPVFGVLFGVLLAGEALTAHVIAGGALIVAGTVASELKWDHELAETLEGVLGPPVVMVPLLFMLGQLGANSWQEGFVWSAGIGLFSVLGLVLALRRALDRGAVSDFYVSRRRERLTLSLVLPSAIAVIVPLVAVWLLDAPTGLKAGFAATLGLLVINLLITAIWKISYHAQAITATALVAVLIYGLAAVPLLLLVPVVMWSRIKLGAHSLLQTLLGVLLAVVVILAAFQQFALF